MTTQPSPLAIVTGGNRGLGRETARQLAQRGYHVVLTGRRAAQAEEVADELRGEGLDVESHVLDVTRAEDIRALAAHVRKAGQPVEVLVNNAGVALDGFDAEVVRKTMAVNVYGPLHLTDALRPLLAPNARVVMVSSGIGTLSSLAPTLRDSFAAPALLRAKLENLIARFAADVAAGTHSEHGWPSSAYGVSKIALGALTRIFDAELADTGVHVNAVCPGWVRTDMGGAQAERTVEEGASGIVWAATLPADGPRGGFFRDGEAIEW